MKKEIANLPVLRPIQEQMKRGTLKEIRWQVAGEWAVGDCYKEMTYLGRYVIDRKGRHGLLKGRERVPVTLLWIFERVTDSWTFPKDIQCDRDELKEIRSFLDPENRHHWRENGMDVVCALERDYNGNERRSAEERKQNRIDDLMNTVPPLPDNLMDWVRETVWPNDFLFPSDAEYDTEDEHGKAYYCTACRKLHRYKAPVKLGALERCPETGRTLIRKRKGSKIEDREKILVLQRAGQGLSVARHLNLRRWMFDGRADIDVMEEIRIILYQRDSVEPFRQDKKDKKDKVYYGQHHWADEFEQEWSDRNPWTKHMTRCWCYPEGIKDALAGTLYERTPVEKMALRGWKLDYNEVMLSCINSVLPNILEFMTGMNLKKLVSGIVNNQISWGRYLGGILNLEGENAPEVLGINAQRIRRLCALNGGTTMLAWLKEEQRSGRKIKDEVLLWMERKALRPGAFSFILRKMSPEQIMNYLVRENKARPGWTTDQMIGIWKDYLSMAGRLGLDTNDEIVYRTKNLLVRHDEAVEEFGRRRDEIEAAEFKRKYGGITRACARIRDKFDYSGDKYCVITPRGARDIIEDSRQLHHCAGASDRYYERIEQDETYILFLRRKEAPEKAYYTLEVEPDGTTRQKRSAYNRQPDLQEINAFLREWQAVVRRRLKEADREAARVSAAKRAEEMAALAASGRQRDIDLFKALEADLLAAAT